MLIVIRLF
ncbi:hypothetical protein NUU61_005913 (mitochondrion) [Penicillium alfredii]|uniref:Uncharacterized protein n=1 Tax=Penicillium alfredii TaxID=1506179 RepID=A0A9W9F781_9EURO|nr:hypothetical protein NUU61_005913 [Penicillium alfredii]